MFHTAQNVKHVNCILAHAMNLVNKEGSESYCYWPSNFYTQFLPYLSGHFFEVSMLSSGRFHYTRLDDRSATIADKRP